MIRKIEIVDLPTDMVRVIEHSNTAAVVYEGLRTDVPDAMRKYFPPEPLDVSVPRDQMGDAIESMLTAVGITKERYAAIKEAVGLPPTCNCEARREYLNRVGEKFGDAVSTALARLWG